MHTAECHAAKELHLVEEALSRYIDEESDLELSCIDLCDSSSVASLEGWGRFRREVVEEIEEEVNSFDEWLLVNRVKVVL